MDGEFGDGRTPALCGPPPGRGGHDGGVPGFGISRKTGSKIFDRYREHGPEALTDRSQRPVHYANQLRQQIESLIVRLKAEKPHLGDASTCIARESIFPPCWPAKNSVSRKPMTAFGSSASRATILTTSTWSKKPCNMRAMR